MKERFRIPDKRSSWETVSEKLEDGTIMLTVYSYGKEQVRKIYPSWKSANIARGHYIRKFSMFNDWRKS